MPWRLASKLTCFTLLGFALSGCMVGPDLKLPELKLPESFAAQPSSGPGAQSGRTPNPTIVDTAGWWKALGDPTLNGLIDRAIDANPRLAIALTRVQQAREQESVILGQALPHAGISGSAARGTGSDLASGRVAPPLVAAENSTGLHHVNDIYGFDTGWELDLFGKYRRAYEAAGYDEKAAREARDAVLTSIIADLVRSYVDMRGFQMQLGVLDQSIDVAQAYVQFVQERYGRGITNGLDVALAERQLESLQAERAPLNTQIGLAQYAIAVLCGEFPEAMIKDLSTPGVIPQMPAKLENGLPLDLLKARPDIREAQDDYAAANARVGVATADLFPRLDLTGGFGYEGQGLGVQPAVQHYIWSLGPNLTVPLLDFGTLDAEVNIADFEAQARLLNYKQTVLQAVQEVDSASASYAAQQDRLDHLKKALEASEQSVSLASQRFDRGLTDSLNVIDAQRQQYTLEQQYVAAEQNSAEQFITLYKALGGGWENYQKLPPAPTPLPALVAAMKRAFE